MIFIIKEGVFKLSNGHSTANLSSANFANVASTCASTRRRVFGAFRVEVVTRQTRQSRRHSPSRVAWTRQTRRHSPSRVARTRQTRKRRVWRVWRDLCEFSESGRFGECRLDRFMHIKYVICAKNNLSYYARLCRAVLGGFARLTDIRQRPFLRKM